MNIIKYDNYFSQVITVDNTQITVDNTEITIDNLDTQISSYRIEVIPRKYDIEIKIDIREPYSNTIESYTPMAIIDNGVLMVNLTEFIPIEDVIYEVNIYDQEQKILWYGQCMYTTKEIQNYQVNNSDENNLRF